MWGILWIIEDNGVMTVNFERFDDFLDPPRSQLMIGVGDFANHPGHYIAQKCHETVHSENKNSNENRGDSKVMVFPLDPQYPEAGRVQPCSSPPPNMSICRWISAGCD